MASSEGELEEQLKEAGEKLVHPPTNVNELLLLLDQVENCLSRVEQSPSESMQNALYPSMKALVADDLLRHSDSDVKVAVSSCVSEITRITAPDAPYDDDQMKEIFQLIVGAFEKLFDTSCRSYSKRVSILETVAKVRSCVVMLDLECDALILEMFKHFLKAIRDDHPENVFSAMETIMTLVLEESEDISVELLSPLLDSVRKENKDVLPIAQKLGKRVIGNCAAKLKPYMIQAVEVLGISFNDYSDIVASVCCETSDAAEHNKGDALGERLADESKLLVKEASELPPETTGSGSLDPAVNKSPKSVMSNGNAQTGNDDGATDPSSPKKKPERPRRTNQSKSIDGAMKTESDTLETEKLIKPEMKPDQAMKKARGRKPNSLITEGSDHSRIDHEKESVELPDRRKSRRKDVDSATSECPSTKNMGVSSEQDKENQAHASPPVASPSEVMNTSSPIQTDKDGTRSKKGRRVPTKKGSRSQVVPGSPPRGDSLSDHGEDEATPSTVKKDSEDISESEAKPQKRTGKKASTPNQVDTVPKKESGATSDSDVKLLKKSGKKVNGKIIGEDEASGKQQGGKKPRSRGKTLSEKDVEEPSKQVSASSAKSATKALKKGESQVEDTPKISSKRKRTPAMGGTSEPQHGAIEYDEKLVGSKVEVYWPDDRAFYKGEITDFDPVERKHEVSYYDGDVENLNLAEEKFHFIEEDDVGEETDLPSPDASSDEHRKKKAKSNSDSSTKQGVADVSAKRVEGVSTSKSRSEATKSGGKSKENVKLGSKSKDDSPKTVNKSKVETPKTGSMSKDALKSRSKSKDDASKNKSKEETPKRSAKSKGETTKTSGKTTNANGTAAKGNASSLKVLGKEDSVKGKSESAKAQESETKGGKKRGRVKGR